MRRGRARLPPPAGCSRDAAQATPRAARAPRGPAAPGRQAARSTACRLGSQTPSQTPGCRRRCPVRPWCALQVNTHTPWLPGAPNSPRACPDCMLKRHTRPASDPRYAKLPQADMATVCPSACGGRGTLMTPNSSSSGCSTCFPIACASAAAACGHLCLERPRARKPAPQMAGDNAIPVLLSDGFCNSTRHSTTQDVATPL